MRKTHFNNALRLHLLLPLLLLLACSKPAEEGKVRQKMTGKVQIVRNGNGYQLLRDGQPYFIKGGGGHAHYDVLKECGGNSVRIWDTKQARQVLDEAHRLGLTVTLGLEVGRERQGFDYNDEKAVAAQLAKLKKEVLLYKDHPALLMWGIGNEVQLRSTNLKVWTAVNDIARMIHRVDPDHPVTTMIPTDPTHLAAVKQYCPDLDLLAFNAFGTLEYLKDFLGPNKWDGPYILSEWGPWGQWHNLERTSWDASFEFTSTAKAGMYKTAYQSAIEGDSLNCLGSYAFYWGYKQERTATWHSLFTEEGYRTEAVDVLEQFWKGTPVANRAPVIATATLIGKEAGNDILLDRAAVVKAAVTANDPEGDSLTIQWGVYTDLGAADYAVGGDIEVRPVQLRELSPIASGNTFTFTTPKRQGAYRLFVYVHDGKKHAATANIPFYVL
jgi:hypothetical protein